MYPNAFLKSLWRLELKPQVFVAMSFEERYETRFKEIIAPAIESIEIKGESLKPYRVDLSKTGDSILTDIIDGIAHSQFFLADVSSIGKDSVTGKSYRNGNVMYEVGIALACRQSTEILIVRDDQEKFLFDISTIPHMTVDFTKKETAKMILREEILSRLKEHNYFKNARVSMILSSLTDEEVSLLHYMGSITLQEETRSKGLNFNDLFGFPEISNLLKHQLIERERVSFHDSWIKKKLNQEPNEKTSIMGEYRLTKFGNEICKVLSYTSYFRSRKGSLLP